MKITDLLDGTDHGQLKVRVFSYLNQHFKDLPYLPEEIHQKTMDTFQLDEVKAIVEEWIDIQVND